MALSVENLFHTLREQLEYRLTDRPELAAFFAFERSFGRSDASSLARLDAMRGVGAQRAAIGPGNLALALHAAGNSDLVTTLEGMRQSLEEKIHATPEFRALVSLEKAMADFLNETPAAAEAPATEAAAPSAPEPAPPLAEIAPEPMQPTTPAFDPAPMHEPAPANVWNSNPTY